MIQLVAVAAFFAAGPRTWTPTPPAPPLPDKPAVVESTYDRFRDETNVSVRMNPTNDQLFLGWVGIRSKVHGKAGPNPDAQYVFYFEIVDEVRYSACHSVAVLSDGKVTRVGPVSYAEHSSNEMVAFALPSASVSQIANAEKVEIEVCKDVFVFNGGTSRAALRQLVAFVEFPPPTPTPPPPTTPQPSAPPSP